MELVGATTVANSQLTPTLVSFDMRAPEWGNATNELYRATIEMAASASTASA
jgi:hypothetical protein